MSRIVWWETETPAPEAFQRFHGELWGWAFEPAFADTALGADYWIIRSDGGGIGGIGGVQRAATGVRPQTGTRVYVEVDDLEAVLARVRELGGRVERGRTFLGEDRWFATAVDPTGVSFGMWTEHPVGGAA